MRYSKYIVVLLALITAACTTDEIIQPFEGDGSNRLQIVGRVIPFTDCDVTTRAGKSEPKEYEIKTLDLAIFGNDNKCVYYKHSPNGESVFGIDRGVDTDEPKDGLPNNGDFMGIDQANLKECHIYAVANVPELKASGLGVGNTMQEFLAITTSVQGIDVPSTGMPMLGSYVGTTVIDLSLTSTIKGNTPFEVQMKALYSKMVFNIDVFADQNNTDVTSNFEITGFNVYNVTSSVDFAGGTESAKGLKNGTNDGTLLIKEGDDPKVFSGAITGSRVAYDRGEGISFSFYLPERFVQAETAADEYNYPFKKDGVIRDEDLFLRQRYKPLIAQNTATYVKFTGVFTNHQGHTYDVSYDIYVGNDNYSNFDVVRNRQYNNNITIKGIQNSKDQSNDSNSISIDHRVNISRTLPYIANLRRETLLDAHFEVRPLRIRVNMNDASNANGIKENSAVKVEVLNVDGTKNNLPSWIRLERSYGEDTNAEGQSLYCTAGSAAGKRKYFTYGLVSGEQIDGTDEPYNISGNTFAIVPMKIENECVWIYVDECTDASTDKDAKRSAKICLTYGIMNGDNFVRDGGVDSLFYTINQHQLFEVETKPSEKDTTIVYCIEHEEEYLHNFDVDESFYGLDGKPIINFDGMQWGLNDIQLSHLHDAIHINVQSGFLNSILQIFGVKSTEEMCNNKLKEKGLDAKYDFYLSRDTKNSKLTIRDFSGHEFNKEIATYLKESYPSDVNAKIDGEGTELDITPRSALAYCLNRNKRKYPNGEIVYKNTDGTWNTDHLKWYMPAIDEIEDIMEKAHASFDDFHGKKYWSCQPAFNKYDLNIKYYKKPLIGDKEEQDPILGSFYLDNKMRARATKAEYENGSFNEVISSGTDPSGEQLGELTSRTLSADFVLGDMIDYGELSYDSYPGNLSRLDKARVRAVRKLD